MPRPARYSRSMFMVRRPSFCTPRRRVARLICSDESSKFFNSNSSQSRRWCAASSVLLATINSQPNRATTGRSAASTPANAPSVMRTRNGRPCPASAERGGWQWDDVDGGLSAQEATNLIRARLGDADQGLVGRAPDMRGHDDIRQSPERVRCARRLVLADVKCSTVQPPLPQCRFHSGLVDHRTARQVEKEGTRFHATDSIRVEQMHRSRVEWHMQCQEIGRGTDLVERHPLDSAL